MIELTRRKALLAGSAGFGALFAGCVGNEDDEQDDEGTGAGNDDAADGVSVVGTETLQLGPSARKPVWAETDEDASGVVYRYGSPDDIESPDVGVLIEREAVDEFIDETDFETSVLLQVGSIGPNLCYAAVEMSDFAVEDDTLVGQAVATEVDPDELDDVDSGDDVDNEDDTDDGGETDVCAQVITYSWVLVRVEFDDTPPEAVALDITDGWGNEGTVTAPPE